jgi:hypothetical protein
MSVSLQVSNRIDQKYCDEISCEIYATGRYPKLELFNLIT